MSDIFVSYTREDVERARPLVKALEQRGWSVWWDPTLLPGDSWEDLIEAALDAARCVVVLWSRASVKSKWVRAEAAEGERRGILVPALLDDVLVPLAFRGLQTADLGQWPTPEFDVVAKAVEKVLTKHSSATASSVYSFSAGRIDTAAPGQARLNPKDGLTYVWLPPGCFVMGCSQGDTACYDEEKPAHRVTLSRGFWLGQTPVTQEAYERVMGRNPSYFKGPHLPVERVSWAEAAEYCRRLGLRLPAEAEWEYAARAGTTGARYGNVDEIAWHQGNSDRQTQRVTSKAPNPWGLYDMLGNVWEWVADWYDEAYYHESPSVDPEGPSAGRYRSLRGGAWNYDPRLVRVSDRGRLEPADRNTNLGFRCAGEEI